MLTDLHVLESGDMMLLDVPAAEVSQVADRLEQFHFTEDVQIATLGTLRSIWIHGPQAARMLGRDEYADWSQYQNARIEFAGTPVVVARIDQLGVPGFVLHVDAQRQDEVARVLAASGAPHATPATLESARIEARYPVFGVDMTSDTIPLEAGIEDRAISLTKGCYVGQEVIIRILHRGHGRIVRKLVRLQVEGETPQRGAKVFGADRDIGLITSAAKSPRLGAIALGYLHRDFLEAGTAVEVQSGGTRVRAAVS
jgi:folate-binding protein YgfZ